MKLIRLEITFENELQDCGLFQDLETFLSSETADHWYTKFEQILPITPHTGNPNAKCWFTPKGFHACAEALDEMLSCLLDRGASYAIRTMDIDNGFVAVRSLYLDDLQCTLDMAYASRTAALSDYVYIHNNQEFRDIASKYLIENRLTPHFPPTIGPVKHIDIWCFDTQKRIIRRVGEDSLDMVLVRPDPEGYGNITVFNNGHIYPLMASEFGELKQPVKCPYDRHKKCKGTPPHCEQCHVYQKSKPQKGTKS